MYAKSHLCAFVAVFVANWFCFCRYLLFITEWYWNDGGNLRCLNYVVKLSANQRSTYIHVYIRHWRRRNAHSVLLQPKQREEGMSDEEWNRKSRQRYKNKMAAMRCREKKRLDAVKLEQVRARLSSAVRDVWVWRHGRWLKCWSDKRQNYDQIIFWVDTMPRSRRFYVITCLSRIISH